MPEIQKVAQICSTPGVRRDGTTLDSDFFTEGQWVRFYRGRPKKMGGFIQITNQLHGPIRSTLVWSRGQLNTVYTFSPSKIEMMLVDSNGSGGVIYDRTPAGFSTDANHLWTVDTMYDDSVGSQGTIVIAHANKALSDIDDTNSTQVYMGLATGNTALTAISGLTVSGGIVAIAPYLVYYGTDGSVGWSDANLPQTLTGGDSGSDRVTGAKIVKGLPLRSGQGPACLLWSLDSLILMQWVGGDQIFRFSTISSQSSILSQNGVIEYDGSYFWAGVDRFMVYSGGQIAELPNQMNANWFFDNLSFTNRQKVWAMKIPRFGEIWWFFPFGEATECTHAVIFNVREKTWYDCELARSSGYYSQVFHYPVMSNSAAVQNQQSLTYTVSVGSFLLGDSIEGSTSGATGVITFSPDATHSVVTNTNSNQFVSGEGITNLSRSGSGTLTAISSTYSTFVHERGKDSVIGDTQSAIESYFTTSDFGYPTGGATEQNNREGINRWTRLIRVEPDFVQTGEMTVEVTGSEFAQTEVTTSNPYTFASDTGKIDMREQRRQIHLRFRSNVVGGDYEMGRVIMHTEPGDIRS